MRKMLLLFAACALLACSSDSTPTASDAGGGSGGNDAGASQADQDRETAGADKLARPPGSLARPAQAGLPADLRPPKE